MHYSKKEMDMIRNVYRMASPQDFRPLYEHMVAVGIDRDGLNSEAWINKMTVMTTNMWEKAYKEAQKNIDKAKEIGGNTFDYVFSEDPEKSDEALENLTRQQ